MVSPQCRATGPIGARTPWTCIVIHFLQRSGKSIFRREVMAHGVSEDLANYANVLRPTCERVPPATVPNQSSIRDLSRLAARHWALDVRCRRNEVSVLLATLSLRQGVVQAAGSSRSEGDLFGVMDL